MIDDPTNEGTSDENTSDPCTWDGESPFDAYFSKETLADPKVQKFFTGCSKAREALASEKQKYSTLFETLFDRAPTDDDMNMKPAGQSVHELLENDAEFDKFIADAKVQAKLAGKLSEFTAFKEHMDKLKAEYEAKSAENEKTWTDKLSETEKTWTGKLTEADDKWKHADSFASEYENFSQNAFSDAIINALAESRPDLTEKTKDGDLKWKNPEAEQVFSSVLQAWMATDGSRFSPTKLLVFNNSALDEPLKVLVAGLDSKFPPPKSTASGVKSPQRGSTPVTEVNNRSSSHGMYMPQHEAQRTWNAIKQQYRS